MKMALSTTAQNVHHFICVYIVIRNISIFLTEKNIVLGIQGTVTLPDKYSKKLDFDDLGVMKCPVVFLYPEFGHWDYVESVEENRDILSIFCEILDAGLPWDENGYYCDHNDLGVYVEVKFFFG